MCGRFDLFLSHLQRKVCIKKKEFHQKFAEKVHIKNTYAEKI